MFAGKHLLRLRYMQIAFRSLSKWQPWAARAHALCIRTVSACRPRPHRPVSTSSAELMPELPGGVCSWELGRQSSYGSQFDLISLCWLKPHSTACSACLTWLPLSIYSLATVFLYLGSGLLLFFFFFFSQLLLLMTIVGFFLKKKFLS